MKSQSRYTLPPERTPETVRDALNLFNHDMMKVSSIIGGIRSQLDLLSETEYPQDWRRQAIESGMVNTLDLCTDYTRRRIESVDDVYMDALPAGKPAKKILEVKP